MTLSDAVSTGRRDQAWSIATRLAQEYGQSRWARVVMWPAFPDATTALTHLQRACWYGNGALRQLSYACSTDVGPEAVKTSIFEIDGVAEPASPMPALTNVSEDALDALIGRRDVLVLVWDSSALQLSDARRVRRLRIVDPQFHDKCEALTTARLVRWDIEPKASNHRRTSIALQRWGRLIDQIGAGAGVGVFGTGPGLDQCSSAVASDFAARISCNSIVLAGDAMKRIRPNVICFADPVFHFGFSRQAAKFRRAVEAAVDEFDPWIVAPMENGGWLDDLSERSERIIQVPVRRTRRFNVISAEKFHVRRIGNVLTGLMLPVAAGLGADITVFGCDGRPPSETKFWTYGSGLHDADLYSTAESSHPSFFRDRDYVGYYDEHCEFVRAQLETFRRAGRTFRLGSASEIPALRELGVPLVGSA